MPKHLWSVICEKPILDEHSNTLSLIDVMDEIEVDLDQADIVVHNSHKYLVVHFAIVSVWAPNKDDEGTEWKSRVTMVVPDGQAYALPVEKMDFRKSKYFKTISRVNNIPFVGEGEYYFNIECQAVDADDNTWTVGTQLPLTVSILGEKDPKKTSGKRASSLKKGSAAKKSAVKKKRVTKK